MKILCQYRDMVTGDVMVATDVSRYVIRVPYQIQCEAAVFDWIQKELQQRRAARIFRDCRHDRFKGFRA